MLYVGIIKINPSFAGCYTSTVCECVWGCVSVCVCFCFIAAVCFGIVHHEQDADDER